MSGIFYCGDNLEILHELVPAESVDLIYLDPPFNSQRTYNIVYKDSRAQAEAFKDHWSWEEAAPQYAKLLDASETPPKLRTLLRGLRDLLIDDDNDLLAYITMMAPRLFALHRVLKPTGSLYLHCDPTASHYLKLTLDAVFGNAGFRAEIAWQRSSAHNDGAQGSRRYGRIHDVIFFYTKGESWSWNAGYSAYSDEYVTKRFKNQDKRGRYKDADLSAAKPGGDTSYPWRVRRPDGGNWTHDLEDEWRSPKRGTEYKSVAPPNGRYWAYSRENMRGFAEEDRLHYFSSGMPRLKQHHVNMPGIGLQDLWVDIPPINAKAAERLGYPTQKPVALLERIISASSNKDDLVLDPFCGCGTTIEACERMGRRWIGIDIARKAVEVTEERFRKLGLRPPIVEWYPPDRDAAAALAERSGIKFEAWVRRKIRAARRSKHDRGIDGEAFFRDEQNRLTRVLVSVKGGKLNPSMVRELRGTMERERAPIGVLVTLHEPSKEMRLEATHAGYLSESDNEGQIPRLQIATVDRLFSDMRPIRAPGVNVTHMPEPTVPTGKPEEQLELRLEPPKPIAKAKTAPKEPAVEKPRKAARRK